MTMGCPYGTHRVIEPKGALPQPAWKVDNRMDVVYDNEILVNVEVLNIDSASFTQIKEEADGDPEKIAQIILKTVGERGKQHNPVTGSGGMFIGTVAKIGSYLKDVKKIPLKEGDKIASLVSLSLTPLYIEKIKKVHLETDQVEIEGKAILFESGIYAKLPDDMPQKLALAVLDVAGAPAQTAKLVKPGDTVMVIGGGGKSGLLCLYEARRRAGITGKVIALEYSDEGVARAKELGVCDHIIQGDARDAVFVLKEVEKVTDGKLCDVVINTVNIEGTELASILATRDEGVIYFFSMATSFTRAALGAEGIGKDVIMIIGNGYTKGHAEISLSLLRESAKLYEMFSQLYA